VHGEIKKFVVTFWVMRDFFILQGAPRACVDFCDPTAASRFKVKKYAEVWRRVHELGIARYGKSFLECQLGKYRKVYGGKDLVNPEHDNGFYHV
jgi:hypothetical protein